jgi:hypothetical protein
MNKMPTACPATILAGHKDSGRCPGTLSVSFPNDFLLSPWYLALHQLRRIGDDNRDPYLVSLYVCTIICTLPAS